MPDREFELCSVGQSPEPQGSEPLAASAGEASLRFLTHALSHDLNNLIGGVMGHADLIQSSVDPSSEAYESATAIATAASRARDLVRRLLESGARPRPGVRVDVREILIEIAQFLRGVVYPGTSVVTNLADTNHHVSGDRGQLHQIFLNLALNARDAMPNGGLLSLVTSVDPAGSLRVTIRDTGSGIPPETYEKLTDPSFTTHHRRAGSGIGLAIVARLTQAHDGKLVVSSSPGRGSEFSVVLPLAAALSSAAAV
jgi:signal transduction histidine kinase